MPPNSEVSPLIEPVSEAALNAMMRASLGAECVAYRRLTGGLFNTSYYVEMPDRAVILRIAPSDQTHLFEYEKRMMAAEPVVYDLMRCAGIPVPNVLALDESGRVLPRAYIILDYLDSVPMNAVPQPARPRLRQQLGALLNRMHRITRGCFGRLRADGSVDGSASWRIVFGAMIAEALARCHETRGLPSDDLDRAAQLFCDRGSLFDDPVIAPALVHGDVWDANILTRRVDVDRWEIAAIIDADRALFADREFEAALWDNAPEFYQGYDWPVGTSPQAVERRKFYGLYHALFHTFVFGAQIPDSGYYAKYRQLALDALDAIEAN